MHAPHTATAPAAQFRTGPAGNAGRSSSRFAPTETLYAYGSPLDEEGVRSPRLQFLLSFWQAKRADRKMPERADIDPLELGELLPILFLVDVELAPPRYRLRLAGTAINFAFRADHPGHRFQRAGRFARGVERFDRLVVTASPYVVRTEMHGLRAPLRGYETLALPLSTDGSDQLGLIFGGMEFFDARGCAVRCDNPARLW